MHIKQTHISTARPNLLKEHVSPTHGLTGRKKHENTTRYIKHLAESANFKGGTLNKHCNGLIGNRSEMPNDFIYPSVGGPFGENHIGLKIQLKQKHDFDFFENN